MGKSKKAPLTKEEIKEHREARRIRYEEDAKWIRSLWKEQNELLDVGRGDDNEEQGQSIHEEQQVVPSGDKGQ